MHNPASALTAIRGEIAQRIAVKTTAPPADFVRHYLAAISDEVLAARSPAAIASLIASHWQLAAVREPGLSRVAVIPPTPEHPLAAMQTVVPDMPFLVDSLSQRVRETGAAIDWSVHPLLDFDRDGDSRITASRTPGEPSAHTESLIHIEFEPLADAEAYAQLEAALTSTLADVRTAVHDYVAMRVQLKNLQAALAVVPQGAKAEEFAEAQAFLGWLDERHFTFLGLTESRASGAEGQVSLQADAATGLGLLRAGSRLADAGELIAPQEELDKYAGSARLVVITKGNVRSTVHHAEYLDVISVKRFAADGTLEGTVRLMGLFTAEAYHARPTEIPIVRHKVAEVLARAGLAEDSHSGKNLREILQTWPRDELLQTGEDELFEASLSVRALRDRHQLKLVMRRDRYGRFYSCLVFVPRERYSRELREIVARELLAAFHGSSVDRNVEFLRGGFTRMHFIVRTPPGTVVAFTSSELEQRLAQATRGWREQFREALGDAALAAAYGDAFPLSAQESLTPAEAAMDARVLAALSPGWPLSPRLLLDDSGSVVGLKLYRLHQPMQLSDAMPLLENFGLKVANHDPLEVRAATGETAFIQHFVLQPLSVTGLTPDALRAQFEAAFLAVERGEAENDSLNRLVITAGMSARQVTALRTLQTYLVQTALPFGPVYMQGVFAGHPAIAKRIVELFEARFDPALEEGKRKDAVIVINQALEDALDKVASLDADRILRAAVGVVRASLRSNFYQPGPDGQQKRYVSIKLDPARIADLPLPRPAFEIWVYSPDVEGVHLRGGKVARGGLRWSDRRQDFRTEVLGLMKAQQVKNTVIVPVGAKGGFVVKQGNPADREAWAKLGIECYKTFLRGLLDITDNRVGDAITTPKNVVRYDGDDPYLVVAADKGTATFSDIANGVSAEYGHWLGDAFASGGSVGYDHKKMGITAKGAWESVKRHFHELPTPKNIQSESFSVVGVGDMSGDVFGNGMLLSRHIRLLAAFDHRHIFIDPTPDSEASFIERERLFALPRSSWDDYAKPLISNGGGVWPRSSKSIELSDEARTALGIETKRLTPNELMNAILKAPVDLLWNGGIGTYVKASTQSHPEVGDRANDGLRVNGRELRCKVIGEGGNLGATQLGRIEAALNGVRLNTDAIDNAGGVHSSDREVNIKIPLNALMREGRLTREVRDPLLASMTDDIARFVLRDSFVQSMAVSLLEATAAQRLDEHAELIRTLEREGLLNRSVEFLPDEETLKERARQSCGLTRPELAVLLAYAKMSLFEATLKSDMPDDVFFVRDLLANFPKALAEQYTPELKNHQLKREIIATILSNAVANRMGVSFAHRLAEDHGHDRGEVLKAYATAHEVFGGDAYWREIESLDGVLPAATQYRLVGIAAGLLKHATGWLLMAGYARKPVLASVDRFSAAIRELEALLPAAMPQTYLEDWNRTVAQLTAEKVPEILAKRLASTRVLGAAMDITELAMEANVTLADAAAAYFATAERFRLLWLYAAINNLQVQGKWHALARQNLRDDLFHIHRLLAGRILKIPGSAAERIDSWVAQNAEQIGFAERRIADLGTSGAVDFERLVVAVRELRKLRSL
ncbi:MAG: NAD-glutamate dehydrogenase [Pseudomonadota bacterium]